MNKEVIARLFLLAYFCFVSLSSIGSLCDFIIPGFVVIVDLLASIFVSGAVVMPQVSARFISCFNLPVFAFASRCSLVMS